MLELLDSIPDETIVILKQRLLDGVKLTHKLSDSDLEDINFCYRFSLLLDGNTVIAPLRHSDLKLDKGYALYDSSLFYIDSVDSYKFVAKHAYLVGKKNKDETLSIVQQLEFLMLCTSKTIGRGVYIGRCEYADGYLLKIGHSSKIGNRTSTHLTSNPNFELLGYITTSEHKSMEKQIHDKFKEYRSKGEWFLEDKGILNYFLKHPNWIEMRK